MARSKMLVIFLSVAAVCFSGCQGGDEGSGIIQIWDLTSDVETYNLTASDGNLDMSITQATAGQELTIKQSGLTGDFLVETKYSDFSSVETGSFFSMSVGPSGTAGSLICSIGLLPGTTYPVKLSVSGGGLTNYAEASDDAGIFSIRRTSTTVILSNTVNNTGPTDIMLSGYTTGQLDVFIQMGNSSADTDHTGTVSVKVNNFGVIEGGDSVKSDDFTENLIRVAARMILGIR